MDKHTEIPEDGLPLTHTFSDGVYAREIFMPKGMIVIGHVHNTRHLNIASTGSARVWVNGELKHIQSPFTFESDGGTRKVLYIEEDMFWTTIHVTDVTDVEVLENTLINKSASEGIDLEKILSDTQRLIGEI